MKKADTSAYKPSKRLKFFQGTFLALFIAINLIAVQTNVHQLVPKNLAELVTSIIPTLNEAFNHLVENKSTQRADYVSKVYSFIWCFFIISIFICLIDYFLHKSRYIEPLGPKLSDESIKRSRYSILILFAVSAFAVISSLVRGVCTENCRYYDNTIHIDDTHFYVDIFKLAASIACFHIVVFLHLSISHSREE